MNYSKFTLSSYTGIRLIVINLVFLLLLIIPLTEKEILSFIIYKSVIIYLIIFSLFAFFFRNMNFVVNIPNLITSYRLIINSFILVIVLNLVNYDLHLLLILCLISLFLDGADGLISRYLGQSTKFGEIFDQEVDNFLILILSFSLIYNYNFNILVLILPFYRYLFLILISYNCISSQKLPESLFRKVVCVFIIATLLLCNYFNTSNFVINLFYMSVLLVTYSFSKDIIWLYRRKDV
jgi:phosphatidylglycerophosphate synthase